MLFRSFVIHLPIVKYQIQMVNLLFTLLYSLIVVAPLLLLLWALRRYRLWHEYRTSVRQVQPLQAPVVAAADGPKPDSYPTKEQAGSHFSFPRGVTFLLITVFLVLLPLGSRRWWGWLLHGIYLMLTGLFFYQAISQIGRAHV